MRQFRSKLDEYEKVFESEYCCHILCPSFATNTNESIAFLGIRNQKNKTISGEFIRNIEKHISWNIEDIGRMHMYLDR